MVGVVGVVDAGGDLTGADDLLQSHQHQLDRQEGHTLIEEVQGAVKDEVPVQVYQRRVIMKQSASGTKTFPTILSNY